MLNEYFASLDDWKQIIFSTCVLLFSLSFHIFLIPGRFITSFKRYFNVDRTAPCAGCVLHSILMCGTIRSCNFCLFFRIKTPQYERIFKVYRKGQEFSTSLFDLLCENCNFSHNQKRMRINFHNFLRQTNYSQSNYQILNIHY